MIRLNRAAILAVVIALLVGSAQPSLASPITRNWMTCVAGGPQITGVITGVSRQIDASFPGYNTVITGTIQPCHAPLAGDVFGIVAWDYGADNNPNVAYADGWIGRYPTGGTAFVARATLSSQKSVLCMTKNATASVDCVVLQWSYQGGVQVPAIGSHPGASASANLIPPTTYQLVLRSGGSTGDPTCPGCWGG